MEGSDKEYLTLVSVLEAYRFLKKVDQVSILLFCLYQPLLGFNSFFFNFKNLILDFFLFLWFKFNFYNYDY